MSRLLESVGKSSLTKQASNGVWINDKAEDMPALPMGPFVRLGGGGLMTIAGRPAEVHFSDDEGETWRTEALFPADSDMGAYPSGALLRAASGEVVFAFSNSGERHFTWDDELKDAPGARLPTYAMRSLDNGRTWQDVQKLHEEWTGANRDILQTREGRIVFASMKMLNNPGRHSVLTYCSDDAGVSWEASNLTDLGGHGHHDGATEGTIVELKDGRILQYIRTNWGQFWRALSENGGKTWHVYGPSGVDASSAPGMLKRLGSGRIILVWNRWAPEGEDGWELSGGDGIFSATPVSIFRKELSISFSEDECETWSPPVVLGRADDGAISYPYVFEPTPGVLWITAQWGKGIRVRVREEDFLG